MPKFEPRASLRARHGRAGLLLMVYLVLAGLWTWRLLPEPAAGPDPQRAARLERAARYLSKAPREVVQPILLSVALIDDTRLTSLDEWLSHPPLQQMRELTVQDTPFLRESGSLRDALLLAWLGQEHGQDQAGVPLEAQLMISASGTRVDDTVKLFALEALGQQALRHSQSESAATILERACTMPGATWQTVTAYAAASRAAGQTLPALQTISRWLTRQPEDASGEVIERARDLELTLMLQAGRADSALDVQIERLKRAPGGVISERTLDRALVCARSTAQCGRLLEWVDRHLTTFPEHTLSWKDLAGKTDLHPDYPRWLREEAAICDGAQPAVRAFDTLLRLAATGDRSALPRLCALAKPAGRERECAGFLTHALEVPALRPAALELGLTDAIAKRIVAEGLRKAPQDRALHYAGALADAAAAQSPAGASAVWQTFLKHFPADAAAQRRLIQCHLHARRPALALQVYEQMKPAEMTDDDRRQREMMGQL